MAPQGFSLGSHAVLGSLESHTARRLKWAANLGFGCTVFSVFIHNSSINSFLCDHSMRALVSHGYLSVVGWLPGFVSLRSQLMLIATRLQHSMHSPEKKKKKKKKQKS